MMPILRRSLRASAVVRGSRAAYVPRFLAVVFALATTIVPVSAQQKSPRPPDVALVDVRLVDAPDAPRKTLILRDGRIAAIQDVSVEVAKDLRVIEGHGQFAAPAFVDAFTFAGCTTPTPVADRDVPTKLDANVQIDMRDANRKGIQPSFQAATAFKLEKDVAKNYRGAGFGALASSPHGQLLSGASTLATTRDAATRDALLVPTLFDVLGFDSSGPGYPTTLMGSLAQLRQFFLDAQRHDVILRRRATGRVGPRAPFDPDLEAVRAALARERRVLCEADSANDIERMIALGTEFGFSVAIGGGREAWRRAAVLKREGIPVFLTLEWGDEPDDPNKKDDAPGAGAKGTKKSDAKGNAKPDAKSDAIGDTKTDATPDAKPDAKPEAKPDESGEVTSDAKTVASTPSTAAPTTTGQVDTRPAHESPSPPDAATTTSSTASRRSDTATSTAKDAKKDEWTYEEPLALRTEKRRLWVETRDNARVLAEAGVAFAFGSGKGSPKDLVDRVRKLVEAGLPLDVAWKGMTSGAAELLGVGRTLGRVDVGYDATIAVWTKDPLKTKSAKLAWLFVDGHVFEFETENDALTGKPDDGVDVSGSWTLTFTDPQSKPAAADLKMDKDGKVTGTMRFKNPMDDSESTGAFEGQVAGRKIRIEGRVKTAQFEADVVVDGELDGDSWKGEARWKFPNRERTRPFTASRGPKGGVR